MSRSFDLARVERLTIGTVGPAGKRTFYLQARQSGQLVTLKLEKQQVGALAQLLSELLADLPAPGQLPEETELELEEPILAEWPIGTIHIDYDRDSDQIVLVAEEIVVADPDAEAGDVEAAETGAMARFGTSREQIAAIIKRSVELIEGGRQICPLCGHPMDPEGHSCPRTNGHRPPTP
jgi:uncharacterized repeat protein (TIGR03847 family)